MGGSVGGSKAKSKNQFAQKVPKWQQKYLTDMYGQAQQLFGQQAGALRKQVPGEVGYMQDIQNSANPAFKSALQGGVYNGLNIGGQLTDSLQKSLAAPTETSKLYGDIMGGKGNNYADAMKASYTGDANRAMSNMLGNLDARAAGSGMSGGSRHGIAQAQGMYDINSNLQKNLAQTGYDTFNQDLNNKLDIAGKADAATLERQKMLQTMLGNQQGTTDQALQTGSTMQNLGMGTFAPYGASWQQGVQQYQNAIGAPIVLGSGSGSSKAMGQSTSGGK